MLGNSTLLLFVLVGYLFSVYPQSLLKLYPIYCSLWPLASLDGKPCGLTIVEFADIHPNTTESVHS